MNNVVDFEKEALKREDLVFACECGCCSFYIHENGNIECGRCEHLINQDDHVYVAVRKRIEKIYKAAH